MNIVYNSDNYYVIEYSPRAYEVVDKYAQAGTFFEGVVAESFNERMAGALGEDPSEEHLDEFLSNFGESIHFSTTVH